MAFISYHSIFKIETGEERYVDHFFHPRFIEGVVLPIAIQANRYFSDGILYPTHLRDKYDVKNDPYEHVIDFPSLHRYVQYFVEAQYAPFVYGIRNHDGPLGCETYMIQEDLLKFFEKGYITQDSEPGLVLKTDLMQTGYNIQKPYLFLIGEREKIQKMYDAIASHPMLTAIAYDDERHMDSLFNDFTNISFEEEDLMRQTYTFGFFGVRQHTEEDDDIDNFHSYFKYILSNQFFKDLLEIA
jgi:hypothetical protein